MPNPRDGRAPEQQARRCPRTGAGVAALALGLQRFGGAEARVNLRAKPRQCQEIHTRACECVSQRPRVRAARAFVGLRMTKPSLTSLRMFCPDEAQAHADAFSARLAREPANGAAWRATLRPV
jgi:hypothetical protein